MALFYSSAFKSGPSGETLAVRNYNAALAKAKAESDTGEIVDPNVFVDLAKRYLEPFATDPKVQSAYYGAIADAKKVQSSLDDTDYVKKLFDSSLTDNILKSTKDAVNANATPDAIVGSHAYWYDQASIKLDNEIAQRRKNNQTTGLSTLTSLSEEYSKKASSLAELYNSMKSGNKNVDHSNYGFFLQTNPNTGKIISAKLDVVDSLSKVPTGYVKTTDNYGGVPMYLNTYEEGTKARLGDRPYDITTVKDLGGNSKQEAIAGGSQHRNLLGMDTGIVKDVKPGSEEKGVTRGELTSFGTAFDQVINLPAHSASRDSSGNYYYLNDTGDVYKGSANTIAPLLNMTPDQLKNSSFFLSKDQVNSFGQIKSLINTVTPVAPPAQVPSYGTPAPTEAPMPLGPTAPPTTSGGPSGAPKTAIQQPQGVERQQNNTENIVKSGINKIADFGKRLFTGRA